MNQSALVLLVADVPLSKQDADECPSEAVQEALDAFREAVLPHQSHGISLWRASRADLASFAEAGCLLPTPGLLIIDPEENQP